MYIYIFVNICIDTYIQITHHHENYVLYRRLLFDTTAKTMMPERAKRAEVRSNIHVHMHPDAGRYTTNYPRAPTHEDMQGTAPQQLYTLVHISICKHMHAYTRTYK